MLPVLFVACASVPPTPDAAAPNDQVDRVELSGRPPLVLVAREGDPSAALAVAFSHDHGAQASVALAALVHEQLANAGFSGLRIEAHALGAAISALVTSPNQAQAFIQAVDRGLQTPIPPGAAVLKSLRRRLVALKTLERTGVAEESAARCSGDLGLPVGETLVEPETAEGLAMLERWRRAAATTSSARFSAVGPTQLLQATAEALENLRPWPSGSPPEDPWPTADVRNVSGVKDGADRLSLTLRVTETERLPHAAKQLADRGSALRLRVHAFAPDWVVGRVSATARPRGACLRVDLTRSPGGLKPRWPRLAQLAQLGIDEMGRALKAAPVRSASEPLLGLADPRKAASVAAWLALTARHPGGTRRRSVNYTTSARLDPNVANRRWQSELSRSEQRWGQVHVDVKHGTEQGQAEVWALLGVPCPAALEEPRTAGLTALLMTSLAASHPHIGAVEIEPWVGRAGVGLVAHSPRLDPLEPPARQARRVVSALGRVLVSGGGPDGRHLLAARSRLLEAVGPGPRLAWWRVLNSAFGGQPHWAEPRGTWDSLSGASLESLLGHRRRFMDGPLRLALLANSGDTPVADVKEALARWIRPMASTHSSCPRAPSLRMRAGEQRIRLPRTTGAEAAAYVVSRVLPSHLPAARWTCWLLNRRGGWLERAVQEAGLVSAARAHLVGGSAHAALIIEVHAVDDALSRAVAQVRGLLRRLEGGAADPRDYALARSEFRASEQEAALHPRSRLIALWTGAETKPPANLDALHEFHRTLRQETLGVTIVEPEP